MARVLLVEDDDAIRTSLGKSLTEAGHVVTAVAAGADGVAEVRDLATELITNRLPGQLGASLPRTSPGRCAGSRTVPSVDAPELTGQGTSLNSLQHAGN